MITLLKIILILMAAVGLVVVIAIAWFAMRVRKAVKDIMNGNAVRTPYRIHLVPETAPNFEHPEQTQDKIRQFREAGFLDLGTFSVPEQPGAMIVSFCKPDIAAYGNITCFQKLPPTSEIVCTLADSTEINITGEASGAALDQPPYTKTIRLTDPTVDDLLSAFQTASNFEERVPVSNNVEDFIWHFCEAWRRYQQWRLSKGGASKDEYARMATLTGTTLSDEQLEEAYKSSRENYIFEVQSACLDQYVEEQAIPPNVWAASTDTWLVVFDTLTLDEVIEQIVEACNLDEEQVQFIKNAKDEALRTPTEFVEYLVDQGKADIGIQKTATVDNPIPAVLYKVTDRQDQ